MWDTVRADLTRELNLYDNDYKAMYGEEIFKEVKTPLDYMENNPPPRYWMMMSYMGYIIASCYSCLLILISSTQCITFLPLRVVPEPHSF